MSAALKHLEEDDFLARQNFFLFPVSQKSLEAEVKNASIKIVRLLSFYSQFLLLLSMPSYKVMEWILCVHPV